MYTFLLLLCEKIKTFLIVHFHTFHILVKKKENVDLPTVDNIVYKIIFLIFLCTVFFFLSTLGIACIDMIYNYYIGNPYIIKGIADGNNPIVIKQKKKKKDNDDNDGDGDDDDNQNEKTIIINRSNNQYNGIEFTWCIWLMIEGNKNATNASIINYQNIFNKGDLYYNKDTGISSVNNAPGMYLSTLINNENILHILMDCVDINEGPLIIDIANIPFNKWFHVTTRLQNKTVDVYINGIIAKRAVMKSVPKQNFDNVNICQNGGFNGKLSNLRYYNYAITSLTINSIIAKGPNLALHNNNKKLYTSYLSPMWYTL
jgi:hypothetical protein